MRPSIASAARATAPFLVFAASIACTALTAPPGAEPIDKDPSQVTTAAPKAAPPASASATMVPGAASALAKARETPTPPPPAGDQKLQIVDSKGGTGKEAKAGQRVSVHYVGTLTNGTEFDSSRKRNQPFEFDLGK